MWFLWFLDNTLEKRIKTRVYLLYSGNDIAKETNGNDAGLVRRM